jgi:predicted transcriptional regulator
MGGRNQDKTLKRVTLTLDPDDYASVNRLAEISEVSSSWLIRRAVREFLARHENDIPVRPTPLEDGNK